MTDAIDNPAPDGSGHGGDSHAQADDNHEGHDHDGHGEGRTGHGHSHAPADFGRAFTVGTALNFGFVVIEAAYGFLSNSMALLADAGHNLSDVFGLLMAWGASALVKRPPAGRFTYGFGASTILAALANAIFLLVAVGAIIWEALHRFAAPEPVAAATVMIVAAIGILINGYTAWLFNKGREKDINIRGAYLHMAADAAISLGVVATGLVILLTGWLWLDPLTSIVLAAVIIYGTWDLLKDSTTLAMHAVPEGIDLDKVRAAMATLPGVTAVHDLHVWPLSTTSTALTCHLVMPAGHPGDAFIADAAKMLSERFAIHHATLQIEMQPNLDCGCDGRALGHAHH